MKSTDKNRFWLFSEEAAKVMSIIGIAVVMLSIVWFITCRSWNFSTTINEEKIGQFGDFIGGVVGSILAFAGVILYYVALNAQREDIKINRDALTTQIEALKQQVKEFQAQTEELQETREVYKEQTNLYREQTKYYKQQVDELKQQTKISSYKRFDSSFYNLLNVFLTIRNQNIDSIKSIIKELNTNIEPTLELSKRCQNTITKYTNEYHKKSNSLSIYFKTIYRLLKMIDSDLPEEYEKEKYSKILRSLLSDNELLILYYDYFSDFGVKIKTIALKYNLFKHLNPLNKTELCIDNNTFDKASLFSFIEKSYNLFDDNIEKYTDIEDGGDTDINERIILLDLESNYSLKIENDTFHYSIHFQNQIWENQKLFDKQQFQHIFKMILSDYFFLRKFNLPDPKRQISYEIAQNDSEIIFRFTFPLN